MAQKLGVWRRAFCAQLCSGDLAVSVAVGGKAYDVLPDYEYTLSPSKRMNNGSVAWSKMHLLVLQRCEQSGRDLFRNTLSSIKLGNSSYNSYNCLKWDCSLVNYVGCLESVELTLDIANTARL
jgi:hypothetical protein